MTTSKIIIKLFLSSLFAHELNHSFPLYYQYWHNYLVFDDRKYNNNNFYSLVCVSYLNVSTLFWNIKIMFHALLKPYGYLHHRSPNREDCNSKRCYSINFICIYLTPGLVNIINHLMRYAPETLIHETNLWNPTLDWAGCLDLTWHVAVEQKNK